MSQAFEEVERLLAIAATELFEGCGAAVERAEGGAPAPDSGKRVVASIGFAVADGSRGSLVLVASPEAIVALQPDGIDMHTDMAICDVLGEFANMLLGRLKNQLLPRGVTLMLGTPITAVAVELWLSKPFTPCAWVGFNVGGHQVHVRFDASLAETFTLTDAAESSAPELAEGDMILF